MSNRCKHGIDKRWCAICRTTGNLIIILSMILFFMLSGCGPGRSGPSGSDGRDGVDAQPCLVSELDDGILISCPDTEAFIPYQEECVCVHKHNQHCRGDNNE